jgi:hypothetical protein
MTKTFDPGYVKTLSFDVEIQPMDAVDLSAWPKRPSGQTVGSLRATVADQGGLLDPANNLHEVDLTAWADLSDDTEMFVAFTSEGELPASS